MKESLRTSALEIASEAIVRGGWDNEISAFIKKRMERRHQSITGGKWHCIVGPDFGSYVTHEKGYFTYFYLPRNLSPIEALAQSCDRGLMLIGKPNVGKASRRPPRQRLG